MLKLPESKISTFGMSIDSNQRVSYDATGQPLNYRNKLENYGAPCLGLLFCITEFTKGSNLNVMRAANSLIVDVMRPEICNAQIAKQCVQPAHIREDCTETK